MINLMEYVSSQQHFPILGKLNACLFLLKDADSLFEHELGALNMAALLRKEERASLLSNLGPCCKALCFRRDSAIRKQLVKNEKVLFPWKVWMVYFSFDCFKVRLRSHYLLLGVWFPSLLHVEKEEFYFVMVFILLQEY